MTNLFCHICNTELEKKETKIETKWGDYELVIKGIEGYVCPKCGEKTFSSQVTDIIQNLSESLSNLEKDQQPEVLNVEEVADLLKVSEQTVYNMIKDGRLKAVKVGREWRFMKQDIMSILSDNEESLLAARGDMSKKDKEIIKKLSENM